MQLAVMVNDNAGLSIPPTETLAKWANDFGVFHPVVNDISGVDAATYVTVGYPTYVLIDQTMTIVTPGMYPVSEDLILETLDNPPTQ